MDLYNSLQKKYNKKLGIICQRADGKSVMHLGYCIETVIKLMEMKESAIWNPNIDNYHKYIVRAEHDKQVKERERISFSELLKEARK